MQKILITDFTNKGHHKLYFDSLKLIGFVEGKIIPFNFVSFKKNPFKYFLQKKDYMRKLFSSFDNAKYSILHILDIDNVYAIGNYKFSRGNYKIIGTMHHLPEKRFKMMQLRKFAKKIDLLIVHSEYSQMILNENGIYNVKVVEYPSFHQGHIDKKKELRKKHGIDENKIVLTALGRTRKDKGLDILLESFKYLDDKTKEKILLLIAGSEGYFKKEFISGKIKKYNINVKLELEFISDMQFIEYIALSNAVVLPYKKKFTGNSGPMSDALSMNIPVIGPDYGNLGNLVKKNNLGYTFLVENAKSLSIVIKDFIENNWKPNIQTSIYCERLDLSHFIDKHRQIYRDII